MRGVLGDIRITNLQRGIVWTFAASVIVAAVVLTLTLSKGLPSGPQTATTLSGVNTKMAPLQLAGPWSTNGIYTLDVLKACEVGDALTIVKNVSDSPVTIGSVSAEITGDAFPNREKLSYEVIKLRAGSTTGELSDTFAFTALGNGQVVSAAIGSVIAPVKTSKTWYAIVALLKIVRIHSFAWGVQGVNVTYRASLKKYSTLFKQSVRLPRTTGCG